MRAALDLEAIATSLRRVQMEFEVINQQLSWQRDPMSDEVVENLLAGYAYVDALVDAGIDFFVMGQHKHLLELNTLVLCGRNPERRAEFAAHIKATERYFYEERQGGIEDIVEWYFRHRHEPAWKLAAGLYVRILSKPQLFIEGNHRTGVLVASYVLLRNGLPPFVLTVENARTYFDPSTVIRETNKLGPLALFRLPGIKKRFARFLQDQPGSDYLLTTPAPVNPRSSLKETLNVP